MNEYQNNEQNGLYLNVSEKKDSSGWRINDVFLLDGIKYYYHGNNSWEIFPQIIQIKDIMPTKMELPDKSVPKKQVVKNEVKKVDASIDFTIISLFLLLALIYYTENKDFRIKYGLKGIIKEFINKGMGENIFKID